MLQKEFYEEHREELLLASLLNLSFAKLDLLKFRLTQMQMTNIFLFEVK